MILLTSKAIIVIKHDKIYILNHASQKSEKIKVFGAEYKNNLIVSVHSFCNIVNHVDLYTIPVALENLHGKYLYIGFDTPHQYCFQSGFHIKSSYSIL